MPTHNRDIVVIGASAGGIDVLKRIIAALPADLPAAVLIVLHIWPSATSHLPEILGRVANLKVAHPSDSDKIENGRVYVAPPNLHMMLEDGKVTTVHGPRENRSRPAINPLFRSAAAIYGPRVIGVLVSGLLDDGSAGLWNIERRGGICIVQDPEEAPFSEMPRTAIESVDVDHIARADEIGLLIDRLAREQVELAPAPPASDLLTLHDEGAKMKPTEMEIDRLARRSVFSCPECNGALWEVREGGTLSFRCHVGHGYTARYLREEQDTVLEQSLWSALRALTESAALDERLAKRSEEGNLPKAADAYRRNAEEKRAQETMLREFLTDLRSAPANSSDTAAG
jgi:two-component system, chemotaxis family, protein-glutamate methylesterase/glutaminase